MHGLLHVLKHVKSVIVTVNSWMSHDHFVMATFGKQGILRHIGRDVMT